MELRSLFDILAVSTGLLVLLRVLFSPLVVRAANNPLITIMIGFLISTIGWLAFLGIQYLLLGFQTIEISGTAILILALVILIFLVAMFRPETIGRFLIVFFVGLWTLIFGILAIMGLKEVDLYYIEKFWTTWLIVSLAVTLLLQILLRYLVIRRQRSFPPGGDDNGTTTRP